MEKYHHIISNYEFCYSNDSFINYCYVIRKNKNYKNIEWNKVGILIILMKFEKNRGIGYEAYKY